MQEVLERSIEAFTGEKVRIHCASRTDAGVHAEAQVVSLQTQVVHGTNTWVSALNHFLPQDVAVSAAFVIPVGFDVRTGATGRRYRYSILNRPTPSPLLRERAYWQPRSFDLDAMNNAVHALVGEHDFGPFCSRLYPRGANTVRCIREVGFRRDGEMLVFDVEGNSFLPQQVRRMAGALVEVGLGKNSIANFRKMAESGHRGSAGPTLPAHGLTLVDVLYKEFLPKRATQRAEDHERVDENLHPQGRRAEAELARY
ncbi:MAG: tRNA pseudouridine synthase [Dehalococcoidia bacterium]|nr:tRNA pseudouridine synthase [Dehalococcoidia bacterium]